MVVLTNIGKMYKKFTPRQYLAFGFIVVASALLVVVGFVIGRNSAAAALRDCGDEVNGVHNSIANNANSGGGCGALSAEELITDINNGNPDDQGGVMAHFGLTAAKYQRFKAEAVTGIAKTNGDIEVDGKVVMKNAWSIGRVKFSYSSDYPIDGVGNYFRSAHTDVLKQDIPTLVLFDEEGAVEFAVLTTCANPVHADKVRSSAECKKLHMTPVEGKKDTYSFTTEVATTGSAVVEKLEYFANGEKFGETTNPATPVTKAFTEDATVVVKVTVSFPGGKKKVIESELCKAEVKVKKKEVPPTPEQPKPEKPKVLPAKVEAVKPPPLPVTGPADAAGIFFGTSAVGAIAHRLYTLWRTRK